MMKTNRLILRKFDLNDKKELISLLNDKTVTEWTELPFPYLEKHAVWWLNIEDVSCDGPGVEIFVKTSFCTY